MEFRSSPLINVPFKTKLDGTDAPVLTGGKPSGETIAIKLVDDHHVTRALKINGQVFATTKGTISADGKTFTNEVNTSSAIGGQAIGNETEV